MTEPKFERYPFRLLNSHWRLHLSGWPCAYYAANSEEKYSSLDDGTPTCLYWGERSIFCLQRPDGQIYWRQMACSDLLACDSWPSVTFEKGLLWLADAKDPKHTSHYWIEEAA